MSRTEAHLRTLHRFFDVRLTVRRLIPGGPAYYTLTLTSLPPAAVDWAYTNSSHDIHRLINEEEVT